MPWMCGVFDSHQNSGVLYNVFLKGYPLEAKTAPKN